MMMDIAAWSSVSIDRSEVKDSERVKAKGSKFGHLLQWAVVALVVLATLTQETYASSPPRQELYELHAPKPRGTFSKLFESAAYGVKHLFRSPSHGVQIQRRIDQDYDLGNFHSGAAGLCSVCKETVGIPGRPLGVIWAPKGDVRLSCGHVFCEPCASRRTHCHKCDRKGKMPGTFPELSSVPRSLPLRFWTPEDHVDYLPEELAAQKERTEEWSFEEAVKEEGSSDVREPISIEDEPTRTSGMDEPEAPREQGSTTTTTTTTTPTTKSKPVYSYIPVEDESINLPLGVCVHCGERKTNTEMTSLVPLGDEQYLQLHGNVACEKCACAKHACAKPECQEQELARLNRLRRAPAALESESEPEPEPQVEEPYKSAEEEREDEEVPTPSPEDILAGATARKYLGPQEVDDTDWRMDLEDIMRNQEGDDIVRPYDGVTLQKSQAVKEDEISKTKDDLEKQEDDEVKKGDEPKIVYVEETEAVPFIEEEKVPFYERSEYLEAEPMPADEIEVLQARQPEPKVEEPKKEQVPVKESVDMVAPVARQYPDEREQDDFFFQLCSRCKDTVARYFEDKDLCKLCKQRKENALNRVASAA